MYVICFFFSSRRRHTRFKCDWSSDVCSSDLEFRSQEPGLDDWKTRSDLYATFRKSSAGDPEKNLKAIPRKQRAVVRKGIQNGLRSQIGQDTDSFHRIYAESVRDLGTPVFSRR